MCTLILLKKYDTINITITQQFAIFKHHMRY